MGFDIQARILARKVIFCYFFQQYAFTLVPTKEGFVEEIDKIAHHMHDEVTEKRDLAKLMTKDYYADDETEIAYLLERVFTPEDPTKKRDPDREYLKKMGPLFRQYEPIVRDLVNSFTVSFSFDQMDILDRTIFILGYAEYETMHTPREVMINEMVELAKRQGDESSFKLINGIAHKLFPQTAKPL